MQPTAAVGGEMGPVLQAIGVWHRYGRRSGWALRGVDLEIPPGSITALVGPNGAGKSTLIRSWIGFERPTRGTTLVTGISAARDPKAAIGRVGYVAQSHGLYPGLTVANHLVLARTLRKDFDRSLASHRLEQLGIPLGRRTSQLSGGQRAHVALALALGTRAPVMIMDEPLASLDPLARHEFLRVLVDDIRGRDGSALLSSHIVSDVERACDRIVVLGAAQVMLHASIAGALATHRIAAEDRAGPDVVAAFHRDSGDRAVLVRSSDPTLETPTLEELVMGYLAAASDRPSLTDAAAA